MENDEILVQNFEDMLDPAPSEEPTTSTNEVDLPQSEETSEVEEEQSSQIEDPIYAFLQSKGIKDPSKISFTNEDGTEEFQDFNSLSNDEKLEILKEITDSGLTNEETSLINSLRANGVTFNQVLNKYAADAIQNYLQTHKDAVPQKTYTIDDYTDDDLYLVNLKRQYPDFSDEELLSKLEAAKENEELYKKEASTLRNTYKQYEDDENAALQAQREQEAFDLRKTIENAVSNFNEIALDYTDQNSDSLVVEDKDKQEMLHYLLEQDANGKSQLMKDLENPDALIELAWLRTQGANALSDTSKYFKELLATERAENKKLRAQLNKINKNSDTVVIPKVDKMEKNHDFISAWDNSDLL